MNKTEFIDVLEKSLIRLPKADRDDILSDYEAHFAIGVENGKTEEEVSASLGDPHELAMTYLENLPEGSKGAPAVIADDNDTVEEADENTDTSSSAESAAPEVTSTPTYSAPTYGAPASASGISRSASSAATGDSNTPDAGSIVLVVFLSIAALSVLFGIASVWIALPGTALGCFTAAFALIAVGIALMTQSVIAGLGSIFLAISVAAFGLLAIFASIASVKGIIWLVKQFIKLCQNILKGGSN